MRLLRSITNELWSWWESSEDRPDQILYRLCVCLYTYTWKHSLLALVFVYVNYIFVSYTITILKLTVIKSHYLFCILFVLFLFIPLCVCLFIYRLLFFFFLILISLIIYSSLYDLFVFFLEKQMLFGSLFIYLFLWIVIRLWLHQAEKVITDTILPNIFQSLPRHSQAIYQLLLTQRSSRYTPEVEPCHTVLQSKYFGQHSELLTRGEVCDFQLSSHFITRVLLLPGVNNPLCFSRKPCLRLGGANSHETQLQTIPNGKWNLWSNKTKRSISTAKSRGWTVHTSHPNFALRFCS